MLPIADSQGSGKFPFWVLVIIVLNIYFFIQEITALNPDGFISQYSLIPSLIDFNNFESLKPFITSQFLHAGFLHIASNMWFLWIFGDNVEDRMGFFLFPIVYIFCGIIAAFAQYSLMPDSNIPMLGASGAVAGILGAYAAWFPHHKVKSLVPILGFVTIIDVPASIMLFYWFITQIFSGTFSVVSSADIGGVAYVAHIAGFISGWIFAKAIPTRQIEN